ncbi:MAG: Hsp20/alpha crystallin family protein [Phycisphaeraceae bacterium]
MLKTARREEFQQMAGQVNKLVNQMWGSHFGEFCPTDTWSPSINLYRLERRLEVCVDLAGVDKRELDVRVEPGRLTIRGHRNAPEPRVGQEPMRIVSMEIDYGPFCRMMSLPEQVDLPRVTTEYVDGLLWIRLPLREHS